jgi:hypothetical protein
MESRLVLFSISDFKLPSSKLSMLGKTIAPSCCPGRFDWDSSPSQSRLAVSIICAESTLHATVGGEHCKSPEDKKDYVTRKKKIMFFHGDKIKSHYLMHSSTPHERAISHICATRTCKATPGKPPNLCMLHTRRRT